MMRALTMTLLRLVGRDEAGDGEAALVARAGRGDCRAFERLVALHLDRTVGVAQRVLGNRADAEDVAQEVMMRLWTHGHRFDPSRGRLATWLYRITVNLCLDRRPRLDTVPMAEGFDPPDARADPEAVLLESELRARVERAMTGLPARQRAALALSLHGDLTTAEAADVLGVTVGAYESLLVQSRAALRLALVPAGDVP